MPNYVLKDGVFTPFTYTVGEVDDMLSVVPISRFGDMSEDPIPYSVSANSVWIGQSGGSIPAFVAGRKYSIPGTQVFVPSSAGAKTPNTTYYLYLKLSGGTLGYLASTTALDETITQMYIGKVTTDSSGDVPSSNVQLEKVTRIDIYRLSATRRGTAIPVSTGDPTGTGNFAW